MDIRYSGSYILCCVQCERGPIARLQNGLVYWGLTPQQQPGSYQGGEMMMKSVFWWRKPEYPEETTKMAQTKILNSVHNVYML